MISINVCAINEEPFIERTLISLKEQDYKGDIELIVIDGGSKDNTIEIAKKYTEKVYSIEGGKLIQRDYGVDKSSGDIIVSCDADTFYPKEWLSKIVEPYKLDNVVMTYGKVVPMSIYSPEIGIIDKVRYEISNITRAGTYNVPGANSSFKKDAYIKVGGFKLVNGSLCRVFIEEQIMFPRRMAEAGLVCFVIDAIVHTNPRRDMCKYCNREGSDICKWCKRKTW